MIFYIITCEKNLKRAKKIKTRFENTGVEYYFVYSKDPQQKLEPYIEVDCKEAYEDLPLKTYGLVNHFLHTDHDYMAKLDDDTFLDLNKLNSLSLKEDYIGLFANYTLDTKSTIFHWYKIDNEDYKIQKKVFELYYAEGACYFLSKKAAHLISNKGKNFYANSPSTYLGEDIKVGMALSGCDITIKNLRTNYEMFYEMTEDCMIIHPVETFVIEKLEKCKSDKEKKDILLKYNFLNTNLRRETFLNQKIKELNLCKK